MNAPVRALDGAVIWTPVAGWVYDRAEATEVVERGHAVIVVSDDGLVRGITDTDRAPLAVVLRIDAELTDLVLRLNDIAEDVAERLRARRPGGGGA